MESKCLIIVGMHRSGTSLTTSILQKAGLNIGTDLMEAGAGNAKGHFENFNFFNFHQKAFQSTSLNIDGWDLQTVDKLDENLEDEAVNIITENESAQWGWKDPRTTLFLRFWERKLPKAKYLFIYRNPWEVVDSLYRRNSDPTIIKDPLTAFKAWDFYNREIIEMYKKNRNNSLLVQIDDVISDIPAFIERVNDQLGFTLCTKNTGDLFDNSLYGASSQPNCLRSAQTAFIFPRAINTLNELRTLSGKDKFVADNSLLYDSIVADWREVAVKNNSINMLNTELNKIKKTYDEKFLNHLRKAQKLKTKVKHYESELAWMKESKAWKTREVLLKLKVWFYSVSYF